MGWIRQAVDEVANAVVDKEINGAFNEDIEGNFNNAINGAFKGVIDEAQNGLTLKLLQPPLLASSNYAISTVPISLSLCFVIWSSFNIAS